MYWRNGVFVAFRVLYWLLFVRVSYCSPRQNTRLKTAYLRHAARRPNIMIICSHLARHAAAVFAFWCNSAFVVCCKIYAQRLSTRRGRSLYLYLWRVFWFSSFVVAYFRCLSCSFLFLSLSLFLLLCVVLLLSLAFLCFLSCSLFVVRWFSLFPFLFLFVRWFSFSNFKYIYNNKINIYSVYFVCVRTRARARNEVKIRHKKERPK